MHYKNCSHCGTLVKGQELCEDCLARTEKLWDEYLLATGWHYFKCQKCGRIVQGNVVMDHGILDVCNTCSLQESFAKVTKRFPDGLIGLSGEFEIKVAGGL